MNAPVSRETDVDGASERGGSRLVRIVRRMVGSRIARNLSATLYVQVVQLGIQFAAVPIMSLRWGLHNYGVWLLLFTFPSYLSIADLGFSAAATNDMIMRVARGDRAGAADTWLALGMVLATMVLVVLASAVLLLFAALPHALDFAQAATQGHARAMMLVLIGFGLCALTTSAVGGGYRAVDRFAFGGYLYVTLVLAEGVAALATVYLGGGLFGAAIAYFIMRLANVCIFLGVLHRLAPWLFTGNRTAASAKVRPLLEPAVGALAVPVAQALGLQGAVLVIGATLGAAVVPLYTTTRTLTRTVLQLTYMVSLSVMPAFSVAMVQGDRVRRAQLVIVSLGVGAVLLPIAAPLLILLGQPLIGRWSHGQVHPPQSLLIMMSLAMLLNGLWLPLSNLILAVNRHGQFAYFYLGISVAMVGLAYAAGPSLGLIGIAGAITLIDAIMLAWVVRLARRHGMLDPAELRAAAANLRAAGRGLFARQAPS